MRKQSDFLLQKSIFMMNTLEESFKNNPFCLERLLVKAAKAIETLGVINHVCEGYGRSS